MHFPQFQALVLAAANIHKNILFSAFYVALHCTILWQHAMMRGRSLALAHVSLRNPLIRLVNCRTLHPRAAVHDLLASAPAPQKQPLESLQTKRPHRADPSWHAKASVPFTAGGAASKGTGVFLPCLYDEPHMPTKPLSRSLSGCSYASKESTSPNSELSRIDSSFSCQSSETDCSYIAAHGLSFHSKFPAGTTTRHPAALSCICHGSIQCSLVVLP